MHEVKETDREKRLQYCRWFTHFIPGGTHIADDIFYSDEALLHLSGYVNRQTVEYKSWKPAQFPSKTVTVKSRAVSRRLTIGPIFISETENSCVLPRTGYEFHFLLEVDELDCWF